MERNVKHIDEGTLHAWLDGALQPDESARVEAHVASCETCGAAAAEARGLVAAASRILTALDDVPGGVVPGGHRAGAGRRLWTGWPLRAAAAIVFVVAGSFAVLRQSDLPSRILATPSAQPAFAPAPASAPAPAAPARSRDSLAGVPAHSPAPPRAPVAAKVEPRKKQRAAEAAAPVPQPAPAPAPVAAAPAVAAQAADEAQAAPKPVIIAGRVVEANTGQPVSDASVRLSNPQVATITDSVGNYSLPVPANQAAADQPTQLSVRRIGYRSASDSVTVARKKTAGDTVRRDFALTEAREQLSEVVITGTGEQKEAPAARAPGTGAVSGLMGRRASSRYPLACYAIDVPGLPARIELGAHPRIPSPDSAAFPTAYWLPYRDDSLRVMVVDTAGARQLITAKVADSTTLRGLVTRPDSSEATPFVATRTAPHCP